MVWIIHHHKHIWRGRSDFLPTDIRPRIVNVSGSIVPTCGFDDGLWPTELAGGKNPAVFHGIKHENGGFLLCLRGRLQVVKTGIHIVNNLSCCSLTTSNFAEITHVIAHSLPGFHHTTLTRRPLTAGFCEYVAANPLGFQPFWVEVIGFGEPVIPTRDHNVRLFAHHFFQRRGFLGRILKTIDYITIFGTENVFVFLHRADPINLVACTSTEGNGNDASVVHPQLVMMLVGHLVTAVL